MAFLSKATLLSRIAVGGIAESKLKLFVKSPVMSTSGMISITLSLTRKEIIETEFHNYISINN